MAVAPTTTPPRHFAALAMTMACAVVIATGCASGGGEAVQQPTGVSAASGTVTVTTTSSELPTQPDELGSGPMALSDADGIPAVAEPGPAPTGLHIPDLGIDNGSIKPVGVEPNGDFEVPIASEIGWYRFGSRPGQDGSNVLAAHIAYDGEDGVFRYLSTLEPGAVVEVVLEDGSIVSYVTTERTIYDKVALPFDELFDKSGPDRLVLVTCGGNFDASAGSYDSNIVVFAKRVD